MDKADLYGMALLFTTSAGRGLFSAAMERFRPGITRLTIPLSRLPRSFSGFRVLLISDVHLGFFYSPENFSAAADIMSGLEPDVICLAGDFLDSESSLGVLERSVPVLSRLRPRYGKFAVTGNHDYSAGVDQVVRGLEDGGFSVLKNRHSAVCKGRDALYFTGLDDALKGFPDPVRAMEGIPSPACRILMVHEPDYDFRAGGLHADLQLSGHSHGGQVRLPFISRPLVTSRLGRRYPCGLYRVGDSTIYTGRGLGTTKLPVRLYCPPEIALITLESDPACVPRT